MITKARPLHAQDRALVSSCPGCEGSFVLEESVVAVGAGITERMKAKKEARACGPAGIVYHAACVPDEETQAAMLEEPES